jgi:hypothetical protein
MKFKLYQELLNEQDILAHLFLNCIDKENLNKIANININLSKEEIENREIDIQLIIDGKEYNPRNFFELFFKGYSQDIRKEASIIFREKTSEKLIDIINKIMEFEQICNDLSNQLNWDISEKELIKSFEKTELLDCIKNLMGIVDISLGKKNLNSDFSNNVREHAKSILTKYNK